MKLDNFQIGDRVVVIEYQGPQERRELHIGQIGTIVTFHEKHNHIIVDHDEKFHDLLRNIDGVCPNKNGWPYLPNELEIITVSSSTSIEDLI